MGKEGRRRSAEAAEGKEGSEWRGGVWRTVNFLFPPQSTGLGK